MYIPQYTRVHAQLTYLPLFDVACLRRRAHHRAGARPQLFMLKMQQTYILSFHPDFTSHTSHMLSIRAFRSSRIQCRRHSSTVRSFRPVQVLPDAYLETFRKHAFEPGAPALLPRETFQKLPAIEKWFVKWSDEEREAKALNVDYLAEYRDIVVPLELSTEDGEDFDRVEQPLRMFVEYVRPLYVAWELRSMLMLCQSILPSQLHHPHLPRSSPNRRPSPRSPNGHTHARPRPESRQRRRLRLIHLARSRANLHASSSRSESESLCSAGWEEDCSTVQTEGWPRHLCEGAGGDWRQGFCYDEGRGDDEGGGEEGAGEGGLGEW